MVRRWEAELLDHVVPLARCAPHLDVRENRVKARRVERLSAGSIQVVKHSYASSDFNLSCDLLIVDEAHRAKGDQTCFSKALKRQRKHAKRILILPVRTIITSLSLSVSDFTIEAMESANPLTGDPERNSGCMVFAHERRQSIWALLRQGLRGDHECGFHRTLAAPGRLVTRANNGKAQQ
jgi:hypothetical protein